MRTYYISINDYRSSTSHGMANTWTTYLLPDRTTQRRLLTEGLPVRDQWWEDRDGKRHATTTTMGIRTATADERRALQARLDYESATYHTWQDVA